MTYYSPRGVPDDYKKVATATWWGGRYDIYLHNDETMWGWLYVNSSDRFKARSVARPKPINEGFWEIVKVVLERVIGERDPSISPNAHPKTLRKKVS